MKLIRKKINILDIPIDSFSKLEVLRYLKNKIEKKDPVLITTVNTEFAEIAFSKLEVLEMLNRASLNLADGVGILWAANFLNKNLPKEKFLRVIFASCKLLWSLLLIPIFPKSIKKPIPEKISGSDFVYDLAKFATQNNLRVFLLGAAPTVAEQAALKLQTDIFDLKVAGTYAGSPNPEDESKIISLIKNSKADILMVAYGVPAEELWLSRNLRKTGAKIGIGVGGTFDFLAGRVPRAPKFIQKIGLEWLFRLIREPKRFRRQLALPKFIWRVFKYKIKKII